MSIELLKIEDYSKCNNIWNMKKQSKLAEKFLDELKSGTPSLRRAIENRTAVFR